MAIKSFEDHRKEIGEFSDVLELINYRESTIDNYLRNIHECMVWLDKEYGIPIAEAEIRHLRAFLLYLKKERKLAPRTINSYNCAIKKYSVHILLKPLSNMELPTMKVDKRLPNVPNKTDTFMIINGIRNPMYKLIMALTYGCALRIGEVASLRYGDIYWKNGEVHIRESVSKNRSEAYVELPEKVRPLLKEYGKANGMENSKEDYLFPGRKEGTHISKAAIAAVFKKRMEELGWQDRGYSMHSLRHSAALSYYQAGADLFQVKEYLRHNSINSTLIYVQLDGKLKERKQIAKPIDDPGFSL